MFFSFPWLNKSTISNKTRFAKEKQTLSFYRELGEWKKSRVKRDWREGEEGGVPPLVSFYFFTFFPPRLRMTEHIG